MRVLCFGKWAISKRIFIAICIASIAYLLGCEKNKANQPLVLTSDKDKLLIFDKVPHGITYQELRNRLPEVSEQMTVSKGMEKYGQYKASWQTVIFDRKARMEFNIIHDTLHTYYYWFDDLDSTDAWGLYHRLQQFYGEQYGEFHEKAENDVEGTVYLTYWDNKGGNIALNVYDGYVIGWGF